MTAKLNQTPHADLIPLNNKLLFHINDCII